ncbi:GxxExxY protein [Hymenobacter ginkgonis]|nr:GxxExxY protein [Hymenobacter ginkgonis]
MVQHQVLVELKAVRELNAANHPQVSITQKPIA